MYYMLKFAKESILTALLGYGLVTFASAFFPSLGQPAQTWIVVPIIFAGQFAVKLIFSRDKNGNLEPTSRAR